MSYLDPDIQNILTLELFQFLDTDEWRKKIFGTSSRRSDSCVAMLVHYFEYLYTNETTHKDTLLVANNSNGGIWEVMLSSDPKHQILTQAPINDSNGNRIGGGFGCDRRQFRDQALSCFRLNSCFFVPPPKRSPSALPHTGAPASPAAFSVGLNDGGCDANKKKIRSLRKNLKTQTDEKRHEVQGLKKTVSHLERKIFSLRQSISNLESREMHLIQSAKLRAAKDKEERKSVLDLYLQNFLGCNNSKDTLSTTMRQLESILALCRPSDFDKTDNEVLRSRIFNHLLSTDTSVRLGALITVKLGDDTLQEKKKCQEDSLRFAEKLISQRGEVESEIDRELKICTLILQLCASHLKTAKREKEEIEEIDTRVKETVTFLENMKSSYSDFVSHAKLIKFAADDQVFQADITSDTWIQIFCKINQFSNFHLPHRTVQLLKKRVPIVQLDRDAASELGSCLGHLTLSSSSRMSLGALPDQVSFAPNTDADIMSSAGSQDLMSLCGTSAYSRMSCTYESPTVHSSWNPSSTFLRSRSTQPSSATITEHAPAHNKHGYGVYPGHNEFQQIQQQGMIPQAPPVKNTNQHLLQQLMPVGQSILLQQEPALFSDRQNKSPIGIASDRQHTTQQQGMLPRVPSVQNVNQHLVQQQFCAGQFMPPQQQATVFSGTQNQSQFGGTSDGQHMTQQQRMTRHSPGQNTNTHLLQQQISTGQFMPPPNHPSVLCGSRNQVHSGGASDGHHMAQQQGIIPHASLIQNTNQQLVQQQQLNHYTHHPFQNHQQTHLNHPLQN